MGISEAPAFLSALDPVLWIVTAADGGSHGGLVATFVNPASIARLMPRMAVGIARRHRTWELIEASGAFALHVLRDEHLDWPGRFGLESGRTSDKLAGLDHRPGRTGSPILVGAAGWLDCRVEARFETGDRTLYLAEVVDAQAPAGPTDAPLLTVTQWVRTLTTEERTRLGALLAHDSAADETAIRAWRRARA